jgi:hypothetical protein
METVALTKEQVVELLERNWQRRRYVVSSIKNFVYSLEEKNAFVISRLLPKEVVEKLAEDVSFSDKILDCHKKISESGPVNEVIATRQLEETFLTNSLSELIKIVDK